MTILQQVFALPTFQMQFLPKILYVSDKSFDYAEKIEKLIKEAHGYKYGK